MKHTKPKKRLDLILQEKMPEFSRSRIKAEIMAGRVLVGGKVCDKPGSMIENDAKITMREADNPYVSRGGLKLEGALKDLSLNVKDLIVLDIGASTGGFTDCLLRNGAKTVYALDVGYGLLDLSLRNDPRVIVLERFNVRYLEAGDIPEAPDLAVVDVSFISLFKVLPVLFKLSIPSILVLIKPQFEVGRIEASRGKGVIRNPEMHKKVIFDIIDFACKEGYCSRGVVFSRLPGPKGNIEYFLLLNHRPAESSICLGDYKKTVEKQITQAHRLFTEKNK